jgi:hypothetical protein
MQRPYSEPVLVSRRDSGEIIEQRSDGGSPACKTWPGCTAMSVTWASFPLPSSRMCLLPSSLVSASGVSPLRSDPDPAASRRSAIVGYAPTVRKSFQAGQSRQIAPELLRPRPVLFWSAMVVSSAPMHALATRVSISAWNLLISDGKHEAEKA